MKTTKTEYLKELYFVLKLHKDKEPVAIESIPGLFRNDFNRFFMGETLHAWEGKIVVSPGKFRLWVEKVMNKGLDYVIELENS